MLCIQLAMEFDSTDSLAIMDYIEDFSVIKDPEKLVQFTNVKYRPNMIVSSIYYLRLFRKMVSDAT